MKNSRRYLPMLIILGLLLMLTALLFEPFVIDKILVPLAAAIWLLLRIFVLSIDQIYYWIGLIGVGFMIVIFRTLHHLIFRPGPVKLDSAPDASLALMNAESWRNRIELAVGGRAEQAFLKRELAWVLVSMYTFRNSGSAYLEVYEPLRQRKIALPEKVWSFIFAQEPAARKAGLVQSIRQAARSRIQKWSGGDTDEYYTAIEDVLSFMETSLEMNDDKP